MPPAPALTWNVGALLDTRAELAHLKTKSTLRSRALDEALAHTKIAETLAQSPKLTEAQRMHFAAANGRVLIASKRNEEDGTELPASARAYYARIGRHPSNATICTKP